MFIKYIARFIKGICILQIPLIFASVFFYTALCKLTSTNYSYYTTAYIGLSCLLVYFSYYLFPSKNINSSQHAKLINLHKNTSYTFFSFLILAHFILLFFSKINVLNVLPLILSCCFYAFLNLLPYRILIGFKNLLLGCIWAAAAILPQLTDIHNFNTIVYLHLGFIALFIIATSLQFDAYNYTSDYVFKNKSIGIYISQKKLLLMSFVILIIGLAFIFEYISWALIVLVILQQIAIIFLLFRKTNYWLFYFVVDAFIALVALFLNL